QRASEYIVPCAFHDVSCYLLIIAAVLFLEFVTLAYQCDSDLSAPYFVALSRALRERPRRVTRAPRAVPPGQAWMPCADGRVPIWWPNLLRPSRETAAPICR